MATLAEPQERDDRERVGLLVSRGQGGGLQRFIADPQLLAASDSNFKPAPGRFSTVRHKRYPVLVNPTVRRKKFMRITYKIVAVLSILLGVAHMGFTPVFYPKFGLSAMWFAGTGLALVFLGTTNLAIAQGTDGGGRWIGIVSNFIGLAFFTMIAITIKAPQGYLGCLLVAGMLILGTRRRT